MEKQRSWHDQQSRRTSQAMSGRCQGENRLLPRAYCSEGSDICEGHNPCFQMDTARLGYRDNVRMTKRYVIYIKEPYRFAARLARKDRLDSNDYQVSLF